MPATLYLVMVARIEGCRFLVLNETDDSLEGIVGLWTENVWLASKGGESAVIGEMFALLMKRYTATVKLLVLFHS